MNVIDNCFVLSGSSLPLESLNENKDNLKNLTARNYCYCSYGDSVCDRNNSCVKHEHAACYHATQEVSGQ